MKTTSSVLVGIDGNTVWVKVDGRGTFQNSAGIKEFVLKMIQRGHRAFAVDLAGCELMDSTFMGTLAGIALRLREIGQGGLRVVNVNERNASLLENLGLDHLFEVQSGQSVGAPQSLEAAPDSHTRGDEKETVLTAHEALVAVDAGNAVKFKDVIEYLRQELADGNMDDR